MERATFLNGKSIKMSVLLGEMQGEVPPLRITEKEDSEWGGKAQASSPPLHLCANSEKNLCPTPKSWLTTQSRDVQCHGTTTGYHQAKIRIQDFIDMSTKFKTSSTVGLPQALPEVKTHSWLLDDGGIKRMRCLCPVECDSAFKRQDILHRVQHGRTLKTH